MPDKILYNCSMSSNVWEWLKRSEWKRGGGRGNTLVCTKLRLIANDEFIITELNDVRRKSYVNHIALFKLCSGYVDVWQLWTFNVYVRLKITSHSFCWIWIFTYALTSMAVCIQCKHGYRDSKVHVANMGPIWGRQDPGGPVVDPMNFVIWLITSLLINNVNPMVAQNIPVSSKSNHNF